MNNLIKYLKENHSEEEDFNVCISFIERFKNFHPVILGILTALENFIIEKIELKRNPYGDIQPLKNQYSIIETTKCILHIVNNLIKAVLPYIEKNDTIIFTKIVNFSENNIESFLFLLEREEALYKFNIENKFRVFFSNINFLVKTDLKKSINADQKDNTLIGEILRDYKIHVYKIEHLLPFLSQREKLDLRLQSGYKWKELSESEKYSSEGQKLLNLFEFGLNVVYEDFDDNEFKHAKKYIDYKIKVYDKIIKSTEKKIKNFKLPKNMPLY